MTSGLNRRCYMKLSTGSIHAGEIAHLLFCLVLLRKVNA